MFWPTWMWARDSSTRVVATAYGAELAYRDSQKSKDLIKSPEYQSLFGSEVAIRRGRDNVRRWQLFGGGYRYSASTSGIMGEGGDHIVLDDPHNVEQAESDDVRNKTVDQLNLALPTRVRNPHGSIVVIMQRLHEKDFAGSFREDPETTHLCLPMEFEREHPYRTFPKTLPSGRELPGDWREEEGELLFPELFSQRRVDALKVPLGDYGTAGQLQQRPAPRTGGMFQEEWLQQRKSPAELHQGRLLVRAWDLAATDDPKAPWTVGLLMSCFDGEFVIEDVVRERGDPGDIERLIKRTAEHDTRRVPIDLPQDPGQAGKGQVRTFVKMLAGWTVYSSPETGSKITRADPVASQAKHRNLYLLEAFWTKRLIAEFTAFWTGEYSDQVDAASRAFQRLLILDRGDTLSTAAAPRDLPAMSFAVFAVTLAWSRSCQSRLTISVKRSPFRVSRHYRGALPCLMR